jgi:hypothetical protein
MSVAPLGFVYLVGFQVLTAANKMMTDFLNVPPCSRV